MKNFWQCFSMVFVGIAMVMSGAPTVFAADTKAEFTLEEIVVTAERRESSAQDTPVAVSAWDADIIDEQNIGGAQDLQMRMPSTFVRTSSVTIRGVGRTSTLLGSEPGVGIFLDGFYNQEGATYLSDMYDVERIENVRGPQSTLYGRATIGGAINIISKKPTKEWSGQLKATIGNYEKRDFHTAFGGPTGIENLYYRIRLSDTWFGGYQKNVLYDDEYCGTDDQWRVTTKLLYEPTTDLSFYFTYDVTDINERPSASTLQDEWPTEATPENEVIGTSLYPNPYYGWTGYPATNPTVRNHYETANNFLGMFGEDKVEVSLTSSLDVGNFTFKLLSAYRDWHSLSLTDYDSGPMPRSYADKMLETVYADYEWSQELQMFYGSEDRPFSIISGLYYFDRNQHFYYRSHFLGSLYEDAPRAVIAPGNIIHWMNSKIHDINEAVYAQIDYDLTDQLTLTVGGRYAVDMKKGKEYRYYQYNENGTIAVVYGPQEEWKTLAPWVWELGVYPYTKNVPEHIGSWDAVTYKIGLDYKPSSETTVYGSYAKGYKPGGFALGGFQDNDFDAEHVNAYEIGWKQLWMNSRFSSNLTGFYYDYTDLQMSGWIGITPVITNATDSYIGGLEAEFSGYLIDNLLASVSYSYLETEFGDYPGQIDTAHQGDPVYYPDIPSHNAGAVFDSDYTTTEYPDGVWRENLEGKEQPYSPKHKISINATYSIPTDIGEFALHALYFWQSEVYTSRFNTEDRKAPEYDRVDGEVMWNSPGFKWRVILWMKNVFDETTIATQGLGEGTVGYRRTASYIPPRTFGIDLSYKW